MKRAIFLIITMVAFTTSYAQWSRNYAEPLWINNDNEYFYSYDLAQAPNGNTWFWYKGIYNAHYVQLYDSVGMPLLGETPMLLSDYQDRVTGYINKNLFVDKDGNAIVVVSDLRHSPADVELGNYTAYKISQEGVMLWGEDGVAIDDKVGSHLNAFMDIAQLADGSYVFSWLHSNADETVFSIELQRVSTDGELLWNRDDTRLTDSEGKILYFWPYITDAGNGQCILVYTKGANYDLYARKLDFDGTPVWSEDTRIYRSGFLSTPLWTVLDVEPSGDGGVIITWYDDRSYSNIESIYMSYVKPNGELGFYTGEDGLKLGYSGYRALSSTCKYDPTSNSFIALWREASLGQDFYRVVAQSVSKEGELLWGEDGLEIEPLEEDVEFGNLSLQYVQEGEMALFYLKKNSPEYSDKDIRMQRINTTDGTLVWDKSRVITDTLSRTYKTNMKVTTMAYHDFAIFGWDDRGAVSDPDYKRLYLQRVNLDASVGAYGSSSVRAIENDKDLFVAATMVGRQAKFVVNLPQTMPVTLTLYNTAGVQVATVCDEVLPVGRSDIFWNADVPSGIYIANLNTGSGVECIKIAVNQ